MAVIIKVLESALLVPALIQVAFGAPNDAPGTRVSSGTSWRDPVRSSVNSVAAPKRDVDVISPILSESPSTSTPTSTSINISDCREAFYGPTSSTIFLLQTRADQLDGEFENPRSSIVEALGEKNIRRLQAEFAVASIGFRGIGPIAERLASGTHLPCAERIRMCKLYTERNAWLTKTVAKAYGVLASKIREAMTTMGKEASSRLQHAADEYDSLKATYTQAHERAEWQRAEAARLATDEDLMTLGFLES